MGFFFFCISWHFTSKDKLSIPTYVHSTNANSIAHQCPNFVFFNSLWQVHLQWSPATQASNILRIKTGISHLCTIFGFPGMTIFEFMLKYRISNILYDHKINRVTLNWNIRKLHYLCHTQNFIYAHMSRIKYCVHCIMPFNLYHIPTYLSGFYGILSSIESCGKITW